MTADQVAIYLAGIIWPIVFQSLGRFKLQDRAAQWAAVLVCYVVAFVAYYVANGQTPTWQNVLANGSTMALIAQVVWRQAIKPTLPPPSPNSDLPRLG